MNKKVLTCLTIGLLSTSLLVSCGEKKAVRLDLVEPTTMKYYIGELLDLSGLEATVVYDNNVSEKLTNDKLEITPNIKTPFTAEDAEKGTKKFVVSYGGVQKDFTVSVSKEAFKVDVKDGEKVTTQYAETLNDAFDKAGTKEATITLLRDQSGRGIIQKAGSNIVLDLNNHTFTFTEPAVGSKGTETLAMQLLKGSKLTIKRGTLNITDNKEKNYPFKVLIQHYNDLTLDSVIVDGTNLSDKTDGDKVRYTISNNAGKIVIKNSKIIAKEVPEESEIRSYAFDFYYNNAPEYQDGLYVEIDSDTEIEGLCEFATSTDEERWYEKVLLKYGDYETCYASKEDIEALEIELPFPTVGNSVSCSFFRLRAFYFFSPAPTK